MRSLRDRDVVECHGTMSATSGCDDGGRRTREVAIAQIAKTGEQRAQVGAYRFASSKPAAGRSSSTTAVFPPRFSICRRCLRRRDSRHRPYPHGLPDRDSPPPLPDERRERGACSLSGAGASSLTLREAHGRLRDRGRRPRWGSGFGWKFGGRDCRPFPHASPPFFKNDTAERSPLLIDRSARPGAAAAVSKASTGRRDGIPMPATTRTRIPPFDVWRTGRSR